MSDEIKVVPQLPGEVWDSPLGQIVQEQMMTDALIAYVMNRRMEVVKNVVLKNKMDTAIVETRLGAVVKVMDALGLATPAMKEDIANTIAAFKQEADIALGRFVSQVIPSNGE